MQADRKAAADPDAEDPADINDEEYQKALGAEKFASLDAKDSALAVKRIVGIGLYEGGRAELESGAEKGASSLPPSPCHTFTISSPIALSHPVSRFRLGRHRARGIRHEPRPVWRRVRRLLREGRALRRRRAALGERHDV